MKTQIVEFKDGTFAIRRTTKFLWCKATYEYLDLCNKRHWWSNTDRYFTDCKTDSKLEIQKLYNVMDDIGVPINV